MPTGRQFDLEDLLIAFSVKIIKLAEALPDTRTGRHICDQILRSGTSPAPNYGEAQSAETIYNFGNTGFSSLGVGYSLLVIGYSPG
jgi:hypothetical protein